MLLAEKIRHIIETILKRGKSVMKAYKLNSFLLGAAKALDLGNTIRTRPGRPKRRRTYFHDDAQALAHEWNTIGKELQSVFQSAFSAFSNTEHGRK